MQRVVDILEKGVCEECEAKRQRALSVYPHPQLPFPSTLETRDFCAWRVDHMALDTCSIVCYAVKLL